MPSKSRVSSSKSASKKAYRPGPIMPYGVPINDAIRRGDTAEMRRLLTAAKKTLKDNEKLQAAVDKLEKTLKG